MLKKLIASTLSATFLCSSIMLDRIIDTPIVRDLPLADGTQSLSNNESNDKAISNGQYDIKATNSLGSYITNMAADHNSNNIVAATPLSTDGRFEVSSLEFDNVTGDISICSSQTSACNVEVSFFNDETGELSFKVSQSVEVGEYVKTTAKADLSKLPKFYKINAQLVDKMGNPISNVFHENKFTQKIQEIIATDIHDFEPELVVNLDESEQTNFLVLNEKTIKAESSETENTLVSSDYENNVFVFDNVDDTIKNLQDGDLFYIQPTEKDIIAISVDDISIDGDRATVSGSPDIEEMFDFVKIETDSKDQEATVNTETADPDISFPGHEGEKEFTYESGKRLDVIYNRTGWFKKLIKKVIPAVDMDLKIEKEFSKKINEEPKDKIGVTSNLEVGIYILFEFNFYMKGDYIELSFQGGFELKCEVKWKAYLNLSKIIGNISVPTGVPGIKMESNPELIFKLEGEINCSFTVGVKTGLEFTYDDGYFDSDPFLEPYHELENIEINCAVFFGIKFPPKVTFINDEIASVRPETTVGLKVSLEKKLDILEDEIETGGMETDDWYTTYLLKKRRNGAKYSDNKKIAIMDTDEDTVHACNLCMDGQVSIVAKFEKVSFKIFKKQKILMWILISNSQYRL